MAFDQTRHGFDEHGYMIDLKDGHRVGHVPAPIAVGPPAEYPKWVKPHDTWLVVKTGQGAVPHVSAPPWEHVHVNRGDRAVTILVADKDEEKLAMGPRPGEKGDDKHK